MAYGDRPPEDSVHEPSADREPVRPERRAHPRSPITIPVEIDVGVRGLPTAGTTVNLSRGGALVSVRDSIEAGERCTFHFTMAGPGLVSAVMATVIRVEHLTDGNLVALEFDDELPAAPGLQ